MHLHDLNSTSVPELNAVWPIDRKMTVAAVNRPAPETEKIIAHYDTSSQLRPSYSSILFALTTLSFMLTAKAEAHNLTG